jgi:hypothetical protein
MFEHPLPDPNGRPRAVTRHGFIEVMLYVSVLFVCAVLGIPTRTAGATRSARLKWQEGRVGRAGH